VRTMGCIRVDKITDYFCEPLRKCLKVSWAASCDRKFGGVPTMMHQTCHVISPFYAQTDTHFATMEFSDLEKTSHPLTPVCNNMFFLLKDEDPYVRKTAAVSVAKLHDINGQLVEDQGFLDLLKELVSDSNPMVVANAVAAISEISESSPTARDILELNQATVNKLLTALNECTEYVHCYLSNEFSTA